MFHTCLIDILISFQDVDIHVIACRQYYLHSTSFIFYDEDIRERVNYRYVMTKKNTSEVKSWVWKV